MAYDVAGAFEEVEMALIESLRNNMARHINEEYDENINWTQWQAEMLAGLNQFKTENRDVLQGYMGRINRQVDAAIREAYTTGESEQEIELLKQIKNGYKPPRSGKPRMQGSFFRTNERKLNSLIRATTNDMSKAESAIFRMNDDVIRQTIFNAQMFYTTGAGSMWQCVDMATRDFLSAGYNCVQYRNGTRVNIASYAEMALRTGNKRSNLMGQASFRERYGVHTVKVNARGTACPRCLPFLGKVFIDDVYGNGTKKESKETGYPLLSSAVKKGLFHPNCKDGCSTYYEGINREPRELSKAQKDETMRRYKLEQMQRYYERNYRRNLRLGNGSLDPDNKERYLSRARQYRQQLNDLVERNSDVLRFDKQRLSLRGVLHVDKLGKISMNNPAKIPTVIPHTEAYNNVMERINHINDSTGGKLPYKPVQDLRRAQTSERIVNRLAGGDMTSGSCASVGLAYIGNRHGLDVLDFRGGESQRFFSSLSNLTEVLNTLSEGSVMRSTARSWVTSGNRLLQNVERGHEYYFVCGRHAAIVRRTDEGKLQYLELQSRVSERNGWTDFDGNPRHTLSTRFGCRSAGRDVSGLLVDIESFADNEEFRDILGFINTARNSQQRGERGYEK